MDILVTDLLTMEAHTPSPEPQRYQKKGGDWYNQDNLDGSKTRDRKGNTSKLFNKWQCEHYVK